MKVESTSVITKVKALSKQSPNPSISLTVDEYSLLISELYEVDPWLSDKYRTPGAVPKMYSLFGVKLDVK
jgi:hypothetical protein